MTEKIRERTAESLDGWKGEYGGVRMYKKMATTITVREVKEEQSVVCNEKKGDVYTVDMQTCRTKFWAPVSIFGIKKRIR